MVKKDSFAFREGLQIQLSPKTQNSGQSGPWNWCLVTACLNLRQKKYSPNCTIPVSKIQKISAWGGTSPLRNPHCWAMELIVINFAILNFDPKMINLDTYLFKDICKYGTCVKNFVAFGLILQLKLLPKALRIRGVFFGNLYNKIPKRCAHSCTTFGSQTRNKCRAAVPVGYTTGGQVQLMLIR